MRVPAGTGFCIGKSSVACRTGCTEYQEEILDDESRTCSECRHGPSAHIGVSAVSPNNPPSHSLQNVAGSSGTPAAAAASLTNVNPQPSIIQTADLISKITASFPVQLKADIQTANQESNKGLTSGPGSVKVSQLILQSQILETKMVAETKHTKENNQGKLYSGAKAAWRKELENLCDIYKYQWRTTTQ